jgi:hypothetical protein
MAFFVFHTIAMSVLSTAANHPRASRKDALYGRQLYAFVGFEEMVVQCLPGRRAEDKHRVTRHCCLERVWPIGARGIRSLICFLRDFG